MQLFFELCDVSTYDMACLVSFAGLGTETTPFILPWSGSMVWRISCIGSSASTNVLAEAALSAVASEVKRAAPARGGSLLAVAVTSVDGESSSSMRLDCWESKLPLLNGSKLSSSLLSRMLRRMRGILMRNWQKLMAVGEVANDRTL